jgi:hypothetical protein
MVADPNMIAEMNPRAFRNSKDLMRLPTTKANVANNF